MGSNSKIGKSKNHIEQIDNQKEESNGAKDMVEYIRQRNQRAKYTSIKLNFNQIKLESESNHSSAFRIKLNGGNKTSKNVNSNIGKLLVTKLTENPNKFGRLQTFGASRGMLGNLARLQNEKLKLKNSFKTDSNKVIPNAKLVAARKAQSLTRK